MFKSLKETSALFLNKEPLNIYVINIFSDISPHSECLSAGTNFPVIDYYDANDPIVQLPPQSRYYTLLLDTLTKYGGGYQYGRDIEGWSFH